MNKKGQALVEFILILPILIFMLLAVVDIGKIMILKNHMETVLSDVREDTTSIDDKEYKIDIIKKANGDKIDVELVSCIKITTPGLGKVIGNPFCVSVYRTILVEKEVEE